MNSKKSVAIGFIVVSVVVLLAGLVAYFAFIKEPNPISNVPILKSSTIKVKLLDSRSGQAISNTDVKIYSDNGIRCIKAPCNTEGQEWTGKSDNNGIVSIPSKVINAVTTITATGYESGRDLKNDSEKIDNNNWTISLDPDGRAGNF